MANETTSKNPSPPSSTRELPVYDNVGGRTEVDIESNSHEIKNGHMPTPQHCASTVTKIPKRQSDADYSDYDWRIKTFKEWPIAMGQTPESMADAGFYYLGSGDRVKCFSCKGNLHKWATVDDPWTEHARWNENCKYVIERKGKHFIKEVREKNPKWESSLAETLDCYRSYCEKRIKPIEPKKPTLSGLEEDILRSSIPAGYINTEVRLDDIVFDDLCRYCGLRRVSAIYDPCTHTVACFTCAKDTNQCDICGEEVDSSKEMVIFPRRVLTKYEKLVSPMMIQEANDLTRATIHILLALSRSENE